MTMRPSSRNVDCVSGSPSRPTHSRAALPCRRPPTRTPDATLFISTKYTPQRTSSSSTLGTQLTAALTSDCCWDNLSIENSKTGLQSYRHFHLRTSVIHSAVTIRITAVSKVVKSRLFTTFDTAVIFTEFTDAKCYRLINSRKTYCVKQEML